MPFGLNGYIFLGLGAIILVLGIGLRVEIAEKHAAQAERDAYQAALKTRVQAALQARDERDAARTKANEAIKQAGKNYDSALAQKDKDHEKALAAVRAHGLFVHAQPSGTASGSQPGEARTDSTGGAVAVGPDVRAPDVGTIRLADEDAVWLLEFAREADQTAVRLGVCQSLLVADRVAIEAP